MQNLLNELKSLLATQPRFTQEGRMIKQAVIDAAQSLDVELLQLLISHEAIKRHFFQEVGGILVFDKVKLLRFVSNKAFLEDSYTAFKNKIGLVTKNSDGLYDAYLSDSKEVVLAHPYKDCMLEGGQTKEEQKRTEIFWNEILAPDDIDRLKEPKVFTNVKRYDTEGAHENITDLSLTDNYIIKGNNLLALYSLLPVYRGKVKLIYIDPPYNTGSDSFRYNDSFKHSTWLTFMKDRLKAARELLSADGFFCCHIDNNEGEYVKVLLDEIFGRENYVNSFYIRVRYPDKTLKQDMDFHKEIEFIHIYKKSSSAKPKLNTVEIDNDKYIFYFNEKSEGKETIIGGKKVIIFAKGEIEITQKDAGDKGRKEIWATGSILDGNSSGRFFRDFLEGRVNEDGLGVVYKVFGVGDETDGYRYFSGPQKATATKGKYYQGVPNSNLVDEIKHKNIPINNFYDLASSFGNCRHEGGVEFRAGKKPEELLKLIISHFSEEGDMVLDYHLGSGTTCAVSHKMNRKYIGIEQLAYINTDSIVRLSNVINGEQSGISKTAMWQGGGSFIYMELAKANQHVVEQIQSAETEAELSEIWAKMQAEAFISYKVTPDMIDKNIKEYEALSMEDKRRFLIETLDKNLLYVPHCDMESKEFGMSETDKKATAAFYNLKNA